MVATVLTIAHAAALVAAGLLVLAGAAKLRRPDPTVEALAAARLPAGRWLARGAGLVELAVGGAVLAVGGTAALAGLAAALTAISAVAWRQRRAGASCGCFGAAGRTVTGAHLALVASLTVAGWAAAAGGGPGLAGLVAGEPAHLHLAAVLAVAAGAGAARMVIERLPELRAAVGTDRPGERVA